MNTYSILIPDFLISYFDQYHKQYLESGNTRSFDQTLSVLLRYAIGYTTEISPNEFLLIEDFFNHREHVFGEFLHYVVSTLDDTMHADLDYR